MPCDFDISRPRLIHDDSFLKHDWNEIARRRVPNRLGFAYQAAFVRVLGRFPHQKPEVLGVHFNRNLACTLSGAAAPACAKGLRHAYGVAAVAAGVPLPTVAAVLGHADLTTTAVGSTARAPLTTRGTLEPHSPARGGAPWEMAAR